MNLLILGCLQHFYVYLHYKFYKMKTLISTLIIVLTISISLNAQNVAINTTGAVANTSSLLDVDATDKGILVPRVSLSATTDVVTVATPANSLLVYNTATAGAGATAVTPGYYYYNTTAAVWIRILNNGDAWLTTGNYLTANSIFGSLTNFSVIYRTNGANRGAFVNTGEMVLNPALTYFGGDIFSAYATGTGYAVNGYVSGAGAGFAGYFQATSTGASNASYFYNSSTDVNAGVIDNIIPAGGLGWNVYANTASTTNTFPSIAGVTRSLTSTGVAGAVNSASTITILVGGSGGAFISPSTGVYATASTVANGVGGLFSGNGVGSSTPAGGAGSSSNGATIGAFGNATTVASGTGGVFAGNNSGTSTLATGSGVAGTGTTTGVYGIGTTAASGTGGVFAGNNLAAITLGAGSGVAGTGSISGVFGYATTNVNGSSGGTFQRAGGAFGVVVCANILGTDYKVAGSGLVSTVVKNTENKNVIMFAPESPEALFQDFGKGNLINGYAKIELDPTFAKNIFVDDTHPLQVFVQLEGDCKGVYVANKTANGFEVKELQGGSSNVSFTWFANGNRADTKDENGNVISKNQDLRFPIMPDLSNIVVNEKVNIEMTTQETIEIKKADVKLEKEQKRIEQ